MSKLKNYMVPVLCVAIMTLFGFFPAIGWLVLILFVLVTCLLALREAQQPIVPHDDDSDTDILTTLAWLFDRPFLNKWVANWWMTGVMVVCTLWLWGWVAMITPDGALAEAYAMTQYVEQEEEPEEESVSVRQQVEDRVNAQKLKPADCKDICGDGVAWEFHVSDLKETSCTCKSK